MINARAWLSSGSLPGRRAAIALTLAVHVLLGAFLIYGIRWQKAPPEAVSVDLVRDVPLGENAAPPPPSSPPEAQPAPEPAPVPETRPQASSPSKPDIAIKDKEKKKDKKAAPAETKERDKSKARKTESKPSFDPMQALRRESSQRSDSRMRGAAAREQASAARGRAAATYLGKIRDKVRGNIVVPPNVSGNPEAVFDVVQLPSGDIISVRLKKSSGNAALDRAIERAILKSSPLPKPDQPDLFDRNLNLRIRPLEN